MEFKVSGSGAESKTADIARQFDGLDEPSGGDLMPLIMRTVEKCEEEVLNGLELNPCDLWLYCTAMRALAEALEKGMDEEQHEQYETLMSNVQLATVVIRDEENAD